MVQTKFASTLLLLFFYSALVSAASISWTGAAGNNLWNFPNNWLGNTVPSSNDDVAINVIGGAAVSVSQPAYAKSLTIGGAVNYAQSLNLLSSLTVGAGGVQVGSRGTLILSGNNDLPLSSVGNVTASAGGAIIFNSGEITGPGSYVVNFGATFNFSGSALKLIKATKLYLNGATIIQPTTIQLASGASVVNNGELNASGTVSIFSNDNSGATFFNNGNFTYQGSNPTTLTFQLATDFSHDLNIKSGSVILADKFHSSAKVILPAGTTLTVNSGKTEKVFGSVVGAGSFVTQGIAEFTGALSAGMVTITDSGSLVLAYNSTTKTLILRGSLVVQAKVQFYASDFSVAAGTVSGAGEVIAAASLEVAVSPNGNTNTFISALITVSANGFTTGAVYILFSGNGQIHVVRGATFKITSSVHILKQSGSPAFVNDGTLAIALNSGSVFYTNVDFKGTGTISVASGLVTFEADVLTTSTISTGANSLITISTATLTTRSITGVGSINVTAAPSPNSVLGNVSVAYLGIPNGNVQVSSVKVDTLEIWNGQLLLASSSSNRATIFEFHGGAVRGTAAHIDSAEVHAQGTVAKILDGVVVSTHKFFLSTVGSQNTIIVANNAQLIAQP